MATKKPSKLHPEALEDVKEIKPTSELKSFVNKLSREIEDEKSYRVRWEEAIDRLDRLRYGIRRKKINPWPGCSNHSIPLIDSDINRIKPSYINLIKCSPIATFEPFGPEDVEPARLRENLHDWRMNNKVQFFKPYCYGVDQVLGAPGQTVFRIIWKFSTRTYTEYLDLNDMPQDVLGAIFDARVTDPMLAKIIEQQFKVDMDFQENEDAINKAVEKFRKGETDIEITFYEIKDDQPEVVACNVKEDIVVPRDTKDINNARFIDYKFWVVKNDLKISMRDGKYEKFPDSDIEAWAGKQSDLTKSDDMILMHETCCMYDVNDDGIEERCITTWPDAHPESILRFIELPYEHGMWPYVQVKRELTEDGFYSSRGIAYLDEDFQIAISTAINQAIDNGTLVNTPERVARKGIISNPRNRRYIPGELTEVNGSITEYETRQSVNSSQPVLFQQAQYLKGWAGERFGQQTSGLSSPTELASATQGGKKTAAEINAIVAMQGESQGLDLIVFQEQMAGVHYQIDALYYQFGQEEESIITGQKPIEISRSQIQGKFKIVPNGRFDNSNPQMRLNRMMSAYQVGFQNPYVKQDELIRMLFSDIDERMAQVLIKSQQEMDQEKQQQQQQQMQAMQLADAHENAQITKQVQTKKMGDDLEVRKSILMAPIEGRKYAPG